MSDRNIQKIKEISALCGLAGGGHSLMRVNSLDVQLTVG